MNVSRASAPCKSAVKTVIEKHGKSRASGTRIVGTVRPSRYSDGVLRNWNDATSASSGSKNFVVPSVVETQTICDGEDRATRGCKDTIEAFRTHWWQACEWQVHEWRQKISRLTRDWRESCFDRCSGQRELHRAVAVFRRRMQCNARTCARYYRNIR